MLLKRKNSCRVSQRTVDTVDEILIERDAMYVKAFGDDTIADTETFTRSSTLAYDDCRSSQTKSIFAHCEGEIKCLFMLHLIHWYSSDCSCLQHSHSCQIPCILLWFLTQSCTFSKVYWDVTWLQLKYLWPRTTWNSTHLSVPYRVSKKNSHLTFENLCNYVQLTFSAQNSTNVLSNSPKWFHTFLLTVWENLAFHVG